MCASSFPKHDKKLYYAHHDFLDGRKRQFSQVGLIKELLYE